MLPKSSFELMAVYNQRMNTSVYKAASQLSSSGISEDRGAFFGSISGTLNHVLIGDTIWLKRFADHPLPFVSLDYVRSQNKPKTLDAILHTDFDDLRRARTKMDATILEFTRELTDEALASSLSYRNTKGESFIKNFGSLIQHFFNHQTHHRGQVSTLFNQAGIDIGVTDLLVSIPNEL